MLGAINLNSLVNPIRPVDTVLTWGLLVVGDFTRMPIRDETVDEVVGSRLPLIYDMGRLLAHEIHRVLRTSGRACLSASTGGGTILLPYLEAVGFSEVALADGRATGRRE